MRVLILSAPVGAGHDAAARAVRDDLEQIGADVEIDDGLALLGLSRVVVDGYHFQILHAAWSWRVMYRLSRRPGIIRALGSWLARRRSGGLCDRIGQGRYDCVVSAYPLVSAALAGIRRRGRLAVPCATLITDFDPHPGWLHPDLDLNLAVGHDVPGVALIRPPVGECRLPAGTGRRVRHGLGIDPAARVVLIVGGAWGVGNLAGAARAVSTAAGCHAIVVTGRNESLRRRLEGDQRLAGATVMGYTDRMGELMAASDLLIQNAGGVTCLEAFACGLPVAMFDPLPGHGEDNARHMVNDGTVVLADGEDDLRRMLTDEGYWAEIAPATAVRAAALLERPKASSHLGALTMRPARPRARHRRVASVVLASLALSGWFVAEQWPGVFQHQGPFPSIVDRR